MNRTIGNEMYCGMSTRTRTRTRSRTAQNKKQSASCSAEKQSPQWECQYHEQINNDDNTNNDDLSKIRHIMDTLMGNGNGNGNKNKDNSANLECQICLEPMKDTHISPNCLHRFCGKCFKESLRKCNNECPMCRTYLGTKRSLRQDRDYDVLVRTIHDIANVLGTNENGDAKKDCHKSNTIMDDTSQKMICRTRTHTRTSKSQIETEKQTEKEKVTLPIVGKKRKLDSNVDTPQRTKKVASNNSHEDAASKTTMNAAHQESSTTVTRSNDTFHKRVKQLQEHKEKYGHMNVRYSESKEDRSLFNACYRFRLSVNNPEKLKRFKGYKPLTDEQIQILRDIGFDFETPVASNTRRSNDAFHKRVKHLQEYKEKYGHMNVRWSKEDESLYRVCQRYRLSVTNPEKLTSMGRKPLSDERIQILRDIGFDFGTPHNTNQVPSDNGNDGAARKRAAGFIKRSNDTFHKRVKQLQEYKEKYGHMNVRCSKEDQGLYSACYRFRLSVTNPERFKRMKGYKPLTDERIQILRDIGFDFGNDIFHKRVKQLQEYKEKYGHMYVRYSKEDKGLYEVCRRYRLSVTNPEKLTSMGCKPLTDEQIQILRDIGFDFETPVASNTRRLNDAFHKRVKQLQEYKEKYGHMNVRWSKEDQGLYHACRRYRLSVTNPEKLTSTGCKPLTDEQIQILRDIGFNFGTPETA